MMKPIFFCFSSLMILSNFAFGQILSNVEDQVKSDLESGDGLICSTEEWVEEPPFWISMNDSGMRSRNREWENFREREGESWSKTKFIPQYSIVRPLADMSVVQKADKSLYVPVEVLSTSTEEYAERMRDSRFNYIPGVQNQPFQGVPDNMEQARKGDKGYIWAGKLEEMLPEGTPGSGVRATQLLNSRDSSLIAPGQKVTLKKDDPDTRKVNESEEEIVYVVKSPTLLAQLGLPSELYDQPIRFQQNGAGKYRARECCQGLFPSTRKCFNDYIFTIETLEGKQIRFSPRNMCDTFYETLRPVELGSQGPLKSISEVINRVLQDNGSLNEDERFGIQDLVYWSTEGFVRIPYGDPEVDVETDQFYAMDFMGDLAAHQLGRVSGATGARVENNSDTYLKLKPACAYMNFLEAYSQAEYAPGQKLSEYPLLPRNHLAGKDRHETHYTGDCLDIAPQYEKNKTNDELRGLGSASVDNNDTSLRISERKTRVLMELMIEHGATDIIFSGRQLRDVSRNTPTQTRAHANHIHVCFHEDRLSIKDRRDLGEEGVPVPIRGENSYIKQNCK